MKNNTYINRENGVIPVLLCIAVALLVGSTLHAQQWIVNGATVLIDSGVVFSTAGGITLQGSGAIENQGTIQIGGDWTNNGGGLKSVIIVPLPCYDCIVEFNGDSLQHINGDSVTTFANLTVNNPRGVIVDQRPGAGVPGRTAISRQLTLVDGKLTADSSDIILLNSRLYPISGATPDRYIVTAGSGRAVFRYDSSGAGSLAPIGDAEYFPVTFDITTVGDSGTVKTLSVTKGSSRFENVPTVNASGIAPDKRCDHYLTNWVPEDVWPITNLTFDLSHTTNTGNIARYVVRRHDSSRWESVPSTVIGKTIHLTGIAKAGDYVIGEPSIPSGIREAQMPSGYEAGIFPNPATNNLSVSFNCPVPGPYAITFIDLLGRTVSTANGTAVTGANVHELDLAAVSKGVYTLTLKRQGGPKQQFRVVVQ